MLDSSFLIIRMGSMGDIVHTLPAIAALRDSFSSARIDWLVEKKWTALVEGNRDLTNVIPIERRDVSEVVAIIQHLRSVAYETTIDFQGLYKSALIALASGATRRIGFASKFSRESSASWFYNMRVAPSDRHIVEQNLSLAQRAGARPGAIRFSIPRSAEAEAQTSRRLTNEGLTDYFIMSPGGGWRSKCWPAQRYGELHARIYKELGWRGVVSYGPGEEDLASELVRAAGSSSPLVLPLNILELTAVLRGARFVVAADTGPLHLAAALGTPVVGLFGPTDPERNGPYPRNIVVSNARPSDITYKRGSEFSSSMLSITAEQVFQAIRTRLEMN